MAASLYLRGWKSMADQQQYPALKLLLYKGLIGIVIPEDDPGLLAGPVTAESEYGDVVRRLRACYAACQHITDEQLAGGVVAISQGISLSAEQEEVIRAAAPLIDDQIQACADFVLRYGYPDSEVNTEPVRQAQLSWQALTNLLTVLTTQSGTDTAATHAVRPTQAGAPLLDRYQVYGPAGTGPWCDTPENAADFIKEETAVYPDKPGEVPFTAEQLASLGPVGARIETDDWAIEHIQIPESKDEREWDGW